MADRHLVQMRQPSKEGEVLQVEVVTGVDAETQRVGQLRRSGVLRERRISRCRTMLEGARVRFGIELDAVGPEVRGPSDRCVLGIDEEAYTNTGAVQRLDGRPELPTRRFSRPARLARDLSGHD